MSRAPIALLTDFGLSDHYVGTMKGVILGLAPEARVVDLCHDVPPQDVAAAAFRLRAAAPYFPTGTIFVCVVDPGVGSERRIVWARGKSGRQYLAPDNGLLSWLDEGLDELRSVENAEWRLRPTSATFHGRDVFAPAAARLSRGEDPARLGPAIETIQAFEWPQDAVVAVDRFGNAITSVREAGRVRFRGKAVPVKRTYADAEPGTPLALVGSSGLLELSVAGGSFARDFGAKVGDRVQRD